MSNVIHFNRHKPLVAQPRNEEYLARADHVVLSALYHGLIKGDEGAYRRLLQAALRQAPTPVLKLSVAEAELVTSSSFNELFNVLLEHTVRNMEED